MKESLFIKFPWTKNPANGVSLTPEQIITVYDIITKALMYKYRYEIGVRCQLENIEKYDLDNIKVYNSFVNLNSKKVNDSTARDYVLTTIKNIRNNDFNKPCVRESYDTLYEMFNPENNNYQMLKSVFSQKSESFVNFCYLFSKCNKEPIKTNGPEIKEINNFCTKTLIERTKKQNSGPSKN